MAVHTEDQWEERGLEGRSLLVLYGSETGHSQEIAEEIGETAQRLRFKVSIEPMNDVSLKDLTRHALAVFVTSTTGQGDVPANAVTFWKSLLRKKLPPTCLSHLRFTIFGLGDSSYPKFNWAARKLQKRLVQLGAVEIYPAGEGDERHDNGIDTIYLPWLQGFKSYVSSELPLPEGATPIPDDELLPPRYPIAVEEMDIDRYEANRVKHAASSHIHHPKDDACERDDQDARRNSLSGSGQFMRAGTALSDRLVAEGRIQPDKDNILKDHPVNYDLLKPTADAESPPGDTLPLPQGFYSTLDHNKRVTPQGHWQDVRLLTLTVMKSEWEDYLPLLQPGDNAIIYPKNFPSDAQRLIEMMGWDSIADQKIVWHEKDVSGARKLRCPRNMYPLEEGTLRDILIHNLDITAVPNRTFLKQLRRHTEDEREKERLLELTQESNTQEFYDYTSRPRRTILEVLEDFPGVKIPVRYALDIFPLIRGRAFSIANHAGNHQDEEASVRTIQILVALVEYKTIIRKPRQGLCSRYIKGLRAGSRLVIGLKRTNCPPFGDKNARRPLLAVATGTGIAPIRSLLQERKLLGNFSSQVLFFGCRNKDADFYFQNEWPLYMPLHLVPVFSRDPISSEEKKLLDPYKREDEEFVKSNMTTDPVAAPMGPHNTPWMRSFDYDRGKMYVQHMIRHEAWMVCRLLERAAEFNTPPIIMICGNAGRMPLSVRQALEDALVIGGFSKDNDEAKAYLQRVGIWMETW